MKVKIFALILLLCWGLVPLCGTQSETMAQTPMRFMFQGVARNSAGDPVSNRTVGLSLSVLQGSETGTSIHIEAFTTQTNE